MNIVIMAGGGGTRLWPLSRQDNPKQFLDLGTGKTLIEHTHHRAKTVAQAADIFIATTKQYRQRIQEFLPEVAAENIFLEPEKRDTAPAFAAAAVQLKIRGRANQSTTFMWSDHVFTNEAEFLTDLRKIPRLVEEHPNTVVIMGHTPTFPETGLGYLEVGNQLPGESDVYTVKAFKEKPDYKTAERYLAAGNFYWNMAYISTKPSYLLQQLRKFEPELMQGIDQYEQAIAQGNTKEANSVYAQLPKISIDYALLERTPNILAITGDYGWSDVGYWSTVKEIFGAQGDHAPAGYHIHVSSQGCYVYNTTNKAVTLIGLKDVIVVVSVDAVLVTNKDESHKIKEVVAQLEKDRQNNLL